MNGTCLFQHIHAWFPSPCTDPRFSLLPARPSLPGQAGRRDPRLQAFGTVIRPPLGPIHCSAVTFPVPGPLPSRGRLPGSSGGAGHPGAPSHVVKRARAAGRSHRRKKRQTEGRGRSRSEPEARARGGSAHQEGEEPQLGAGPGEWRPRPRCEEGVARFRGSPGASGTCQPAEMAAGKGWGQFATDSLNPRDPGGLGGRSQSFIPSRM